MRYGLTGSILPYNGEREREEKKENIYQLERIWILEEAPACLRAAACKRKGKERGRKKRRRNWQCTERYVNGPLLTHQLGPRRWVWHYKSVLVLTRRRRVERTPGTSGTATLRKPPSPSSVPKRHWSWFKPLEARSHVQHGQLIGLRLGYLMTPN